MEVNFKKQISEDIIGYQNDFKNIINIKKDEWAFNFWILDKFFSIDEELIEQNIVDYKDMGIDCYAFNEDTLELYLIQNKYYGDNTKINLDYIENDFLLRPLNALKNGTYKRSKDLQSIFTKYKKDKNFRVKLHLYSTNNFISENISEAIRKFNKENVDLCEASIYLLNDIENKYYGGREYTKKNLTVSLDSINKGTILNVNTKPYGIEALLDAKYVFTPIITLYKIYREAQEKNYPIFDKNIREYLGNKGINKNIYKTLTDSEDRRNFFYYNNGVTIICEGMGSISPKRSESNTTVAFELVNPQIVNGCQTVNSIYEVLKNVNPSDLEKEFKDCFVMVKVLEINPNDVSKEILYKNIVKYNNSQNSIDEKTFVSNNNEFNRLQLEFENKGFLLLIKQSDEHKYLEKYPTPTKLLNRNHKLLDKFEIKITKTKDLTIKLEKLLQVILAFESGGFQAYQKKGSLLKLGTEQYDIVMNFIKKPEVTINVLLDLYLLYLKAEQLKKNSKDGRTPIPYYLIDGFSMFECSSRNESLIIDNLGSTLQIQELLKLYSFVTNNYTLTFCKQNDYEYNTMIKKAIDYNMLENIHSSAKVIM